MGASTVAKRPAKKTKTSSTVDAPSENGQVPAEAEGQGQGSRGMLDNANPGRGRGKGKDERQVVAKNGGLTIAFVP